MDPFAERRIGRTELRLPTLGFGGATLGDAGGPIPEARALATVEAACQERIRYFDTSPWYGNGKSELRFGAALRGRPRESFRLSTKVGRVYARSADPSHPARLRWAGGLPFEPRFDYTRDGVGRSYEQSLLRLGLATVDALVIHDIDEGHQSGPDGVARRLDELERGGGFEALAELKARGEIGAIGAGVNRLGMIPRFLERFPVDFFLVAMPYTLVSQDAAETEFPLCLEHGASVVIGAPFASGILATGAVAGASFGYKPADEGVAGTVARIAAVCARHGVPLGAAALQFPLGHPAVVSVIPGPNSPEQVRTNLDWMRHRIPPDLWRELKHERLIRSDAPVPDERPRETGAGQLNDISGGSSWTRHAAM